MTRRLFGGKHIHFFPGGLLACFLLVVSVSCALAEAPLKELSPSHFQQPVLRVLYTASTHGNLHPCATCGAFSAGGMDKRAFLIQGFRKSETPSLFIAGPYEFSPDQPENPRKDTQGEPSEKQARKALKVQDYLKPDAGWLSPASGKWFLKHTGRTPEKYIPVEKAPEILLLERAQVRVGLVFFPEGSAEKKAPTRDETRAVLAAAESLKEKADLIIGVSPWGFALEQEFIEAARGAFSLILGGGTGIGFSHTTLSTTPETLWSRPDPGGRSVNIIEFFERPATGTPFYWIDGISFKAWQEPLGPSSPPDIGMQKIIREE